MMGTRLEIQKLPRPHLEYFIQPRDLTVRKNFCNRVQAIQEIVNKMFKWWGALVEGKRSFHHNLDKHQTFFFAFSIITQLVIENRETIFDVSEYSDD